jgi:hypothetical protein
MEQLFSLTFGSKNIKIGGIPVSTSPQSTCSPTCPFKGKLCYARSYPLKWAWDKLTRGENGVPYNEFINKVKGMACGQLWRHNQAGDLVGHEDRVNHEALRALVEANRGKRGFGFTHKYNDKRNHRIIKFANANGFVLSLSANSRAHADTLVELGIGPVVCVLPSDWAGGDTVTPKGRPVVICKNEVNGVTCAQCGICACVDHPIIGFVAHGTYKKQFAE